MSQPPCVVFSFSSEVRVRILKGSASETPLDGGFFLPEHTCEEYDTFWRAGNDKPVSPLQNTSSGGARIGTWSAAVELHWLTPPGKST